MPQTMVSQGVLTSGINVSLKRPMGFPAGSGVKKDFGSILGLGRSPGEGNGNPLQPSCLGNLMDRGAWGYGPWGRRVHGVADMTECLSMMHKEVYGSWNRTQLLILGPHAVLGPGGCHGV